MPRESRPIEGRFPFPPYPNGWFRVAYGSELAKGEVKSLHYFGQELVLFRDEAGAPHLLDAYCRHLGAHLGHGGKVEGGGIRCPFHAWLWDGDGHCLEIPYAKRIPPAAKIRSWPIVEKNGLVMVWHDVEDEPPIDEETTDSSFAYSVNTSGDAQKARGVGDAIIRDLEKQMSEDIPIWENKKYYTKPMLCDGDGKFNVYRRWMRQFFSEEW